VLVINADQYNRSTLRTVTVVVLTTTLRLAMLPGNVTFPADLGLLSEDSVVNVTQLATVDRRVLEEQVGQLPNWLLAQVDAGVQQALGCREADGNLLGKEEMLALSSRVSKAALRHSPRRWRPREADDHRPRRVGQRWPW
jgi:mRNA interferase MazF